MEPKFQLSQWPTLCEAQSRWTNISCDYGSTDCKDLRGSQKCPDRAQRNWKKQGKRMKKGRIACSTENPGSFDHWHNFFYQLWIVVVEICPSFGQEVQVRQKSTWAVKRNMGVIWFLSDNPVYSNMEVYVILGYSTTCCCWGKELIWEKLRLFVEPKVTKGRHLILNDVSDVPVPKTPFSMVGKSLNYIIPLGSPF